MRPGVGPSSFSPPCIPRLQDGCAHFQRTLGEIGFLLQLLGLVVLSAQEARPGSVKNSYRHKVNGVWQNTSNLFQVPRARSSEILDKAD